MTAHNKEDVTTRLGMARTGGSFLLRLALALLIVLAFAVLSRAGGPNLVAGTTYFDSTVSGQPLVWPQGAITYYTDQGDLSPALPNSSANSFVAGAFSIWTSVPTAALAATSGGELAEDVNGSNIAISAGIITAPADITPSATDKPIGIVYDVDGSVTDLLLGQGAGDASECFYDAVFGGADNFGTEARYQHALIVINGQCAQQSSQFTDVEYRLVRVIGNVLGLGWSQLNLNVLTGKPPVTSDEYAGFPVMHYMDSAYCQPITKCYANPYQLAMDDQAAISRLYPVTTQNLSSFPGKQVFASTTARIYGSIFFTDVSGNATQPMQGVNVVARWINPTTGLPSGQYASSSVSGFLFTGNAGNPVTGFYDPLGNPFSDWGSSNSTVEGFFDLGGLQIPGGGSAQYQLTVETIDPIWSAGVGPYAPYQVNPSGETEPITVTVSAGQNVQQNILMTQPAQPVPQWAESETWTNPASVPQAGDWEGSLGSYGDTAYFSLPAQANRTMSIAVTALDESANASETKLQPVIGMWPASATRGSAPPAFTTSSFNTLNFAMTRLDAQIGSSSNFLIGIADLRGDGRPDYHFHAQVLYGDSLSPSRVSVAGGPVTVFGTGFSPRLTATIGSSAAALLQSSAGQLIISAPAQSDGVQSLTLTDPATGGAATLTNALTYGAAASDTIILLSGGLNPQTPIGTQAANPITVRVLASDGITPVAGATVGWSGTNGLQLSACSSASACSVTTDQSGFATTRATPTIAGAATITATLAPGVYSPAESVNATLSATEPALAIGALAQYTWIAQGATLSVPISVRVLSNGVPQNNATVNFTLINGSGTLSAASTATNSNGYATVSLSITQFNSAAQVNACVGPSNAPCQQIYFNIVAPAQLNLQAVSGSGQISTGAPFQPIVVRVVDSASPPDVVLGADVLFQTIVMRPAGNSVEPTTPVVLNASQNNVISDANGLASVVPSSAGFSGPLQANVMATAGTNASLDYALELLPPFNSETESSGTSPPNLQAPLYSHLTIRGQ